MIENVLGIMGKNKEIEYQKELLEQFSTKASNVDYPKQSKSGYSKPKKKILIWYKLVTLNLFCDIPYSTLFSPHVNLEESWTLIFKKNYV